MRDHEQLPKIWDLMIVLKQPEDAAQDGLAGLDTAQVLQRLIDIIGNPIFVKDFKHRWVLVNEAMEAMDGRSRHELLGRTDFELMPRAPAEKFWPIDDAVLNTGEMNETVFDGQDSKGNPLHLVTRKARLMAGEGQEAAFIVAVINNVTEYRLAEAQARFLSLHDPLTTLPNRAKFYEALAAAAGGAYVVMLLDLDGFKAVNDTYGHAAGDELLCITAKRLRAAVRADDLVARLGGDEFAVLMQGEGITASAVERVAADICASLAAPVALQAAEVKISASVGMSSFATPDQDAEALVRQADAAMYEVKRGGRCGYKWYTQQVPQPAR
jgi:diguanylate cyclase (GGDEF)-like protein/PAS domain S-box-containing protein